MTDSTSPADGPGPPPFASIPPQKSAVLRGIVVAIVAQVLARLEPWVKHRYGIDLGIAGIDADTVVDMAADAVSLAGALYAAHGRLVKPLPPVHLNPLEPSVRQEAPANKPDSEISLKDTKP